MQITQGENTEVRSVTVTGVDKLSDIISVVSKEKSYIGYKIIRAYPLTNEEWLRDQNKWQDGQETMGDGY